MKNLLLNFGGEVKALPDGKVGGYLVRFSTDKDPDISKKRDFFTKNTDFDLDRSNAVTVYYDHALDDTLKARKLGYGSAKIDEVGVWVDAQLNLRDEYEKAVYDLAKKGKLGWSSGTANHLVERKKVNDAYEILHWPLGLDASLTPTPAEPRNVAHALKSVFSIEDYVAMKKAEAMEAVSVKGAFEDALVKEISPYSCISALYCVVEELGEKARAASALDAPFNPVPMVDEMMAEFSARVRAWALRAVEQMAERIEGGYLLSLTEATKSLQALKRRLESDLPIESHTGAVETAVAEYARQGELLADVVKGLTERWETRDAVRVKSGRAISGANEKKIREACVKLLDCHAVLSGIVSFADPPAPEKKPALEVKTGEKPAPAESGQADQAAILRELFRFQQLQFSRST